MPTHLHRLRTCWLFLLVFLFSIAFGPVCAVLAAGDIASEKENEEALAKLDQMSPQEIDILDQKLADALIHYYDRKYASALPLFKEIAGDIETMDVLFWLGTCASRVGEYELAQQKLEKLLSIDPQLHEARLELAGVYFQTGQKAEAQRELETVKAAAPSAEFEKKIDAALQKVKRQGVNYDWNLRASIGYMYDDNINSGPEQKTYQVATGTLRPASGRAKTDDSAALFNVFGNFLYDLGERKAWMWNTALSFYSKSYFDYSEFNYMNVDLYTGPWWVGKRDIFKMPFGYLYDEFGSDRLSHIFHIDPTFEHHFCRYFSLKGLYSYRHRKYFADQNANLENKNYRYELRPTFYLGQRRHIISILGGLDDRNAEVDRLSYDAPFVGGSYFARLTPTTECYLRYTWSKKDYKEPPLDYTEIREDTVNEFIAVLSQYFFTDFFVSLSYNFLNSDSNADIYSYDKSTYAIKLGYRF